MADTGAGSTEAPNEGSATPENKGHLPQASWSSASSSASRKKDKGRLKKLKKRANEVDSSVPASGIYSRSYWKELFQLLGLGDGGTSNDNKWRKNIRNESSSVIMGPSVLWRGGHQRSYVEGAEHRDILFGLLSAGDAVGVNKRKRKEKDGDNNCNGFHVPSWATLHNPAAVAHVAVLEVHLPVSSWTAAAGAQRQGGKGNRDDAAEERIIEIISKEAKDRKVLKTRTRWFPGSHPKSISDALMYAAAAKPQPLPSKSSNPVSNVDELHLAMCALTIKVEEWKKEGYPCIRDDAPTAMEVESPSLLVKKDGEDCTPSSISFKSACEFVKRFRVPIENDGGGDDSNDAYPLAPFVATPAKSSLACMHSRSSSGAAASSDRFPRIFALDCEMVQTRAGTELARATLVQVTSFRAAATGTAGSGMENRVVFDEVVLPIYPVVDYLTNYSGMTAALLDGASIRLQQVQAALLSTVGPDDIVVGHSLENDLSAVRWIHPRAIDTALLFRAEPDEQQNGRRLKHSLRHLSAVLLRRQIQAADRPHCSEEDAVAALQLAVRRAVEGPSFCIRERSRRNRLSEFARGRGGGGGGGGEGNSDGDNSVVVAVGPGKWLQRHLTCPPNPVHALSCESIHDRNGNAVAAWLTGPKRRARLVWASWSVGVDGNHSAKEADARALESILAGLLSKAGLTDTLLAVCLQRGYEEAAATSQHRRARQNPKSTIGWSDQEEDRWRDAVEACRVGTVFWIGGC